jgi:hypothetical protein
MAVKTAEKAKTVAEVAPQREVVVEAREMEMSAEFEEKSQVFIDNYVASLKERTEAYKYRMAETKTKAVPEAAPFLAGGYQYANCLTVGPIQFFADPPYRPSKIIAAREETLMLGVVWINPANSPGGGWPGTVTLGGRPFRVSFETMNLSDVANGPDWHKFDTFDNPANTIYVFEWKLKWPDPGIYPNLYETTFTLDMTQAGQPMAAFSTWHYDLDTEPGFLVDLSSLPDKYGVPDWLFRWPVGPHYQFERPARFLVYRKG